MKYHTFSNRQLFITHTRCLLKSQQLFQLLYCLWPKSLTSDYSTAAIASQKNKFLIYSSSSHIPDVCRSQNNYSSSSTALWPKSLTFDLRLFYCCYCFTNIFKHVVSYLQLFITHEPDVCCTPNNSSSYAALWPKSLTFDLKLFYCCYCFTNI